MALELPTPENQKKEIAKVRKLKGLGDTIAKVTKAIGIQPCGGCKERQEFLNKVFPYRGNE
jgi:hypothetical protein